METDPSWDLVVEARTHWQRGVDKLDEFIRAHSKDVAADLKGSMKIVYKVIQDNHYQRRIPRKRVVKFATPLIERAYPNNDSVEQTIQNALRRLCDRGLVAKNGYGAYRLP